MIYFTADTHLGHSNIIKHCNRPFSSCDEMDETLIDNINSKVTKQDILYVVGDFAWGDKKSVEDYRDRIECRQIYLVRGNHDKAIPTHCFEHVYDIADVKLPPPNTSFMGNVVLCHYAMRTWNHSHDRSWHLYGHSHNSLFEDPLSMSFDCGVDGNNFFPYSAEDVRIRMSPKWDALEVVYHAKNVYYLGGNRY